MKGNSCTRVGPVAERIVKLACQNELLFAAASPLASPLTSIYRSKDDGATWMPVLDVGLAFTQIRASSSHLFVLTSRNVLVSDDAGESWRTLSSEGGNDAVQTGARLLIANDAGIRLSDDNGATWQNIGNGARALEVSPYDSRIVLASDRLGRILRSGDAGANWQPVATTSATPIQFLFDLQDNGRVFLITSANLFASSDHGRTWTNQAGVGANGLGIQGAIRFKGSWYAASYLDNDVSLLVSRDDGHSWSSIEHQPPRSLGLGTQQLFAAKKAFVATKTRLVSTDDFSGYRLSDAGIGNVQVSNLKRGGNRLFAGLDSPTNEDATLYVSSDHGVSWSAMGLPSTTINDISFSANSATLFVASDAGLFRSVHDESLTRIAKSIEARSTAVQITPSAPNVVYLGTENGIFKSVNSGSSWQRASIGLPDDGSVYFVNVSETNADTVLVSIYPNGLFRSDNGGASWTHVETGYPSTPQSIVIEREPASHAIYIGSGSGLRVSFDEAATWTGLDRGIPNSSIPVSAIALYRDGNTRIFRADYNGNLFVSEDGGESWSLRIAARIDQVRICDLVLEKAEGIMHVAYYGYGVCSRKYEEPS